MGKEYGATTGRSRRCGWFDALIARHSVRLNNLKTIAITKLDVLSGQRSVKICTAYKYKNKVFKELPADSRVLAQCRPIYENWAGWEEDISPIREYKDLPQNARRYLERIEQLLGVEIKIISVGSQREETIFKESFAKI